MPFVAPWNQPPNYLAAMSEGANLGLHQRQQDFAEQHAADLLRESYAHLAAQQAIEQQRLQGAMAYHQAALGLRQDQMDALNNYRNSRLGTMADAQDIQQQNADERARHDQAVEDARQALQGQAGITTLPEAPGYTFLRNPSGAMSIVSRPEKAANDIARQHLALSALNAMAPKSGEDPTSTDYQNRTNAVGSILRSLTPTNQLPASASSAPVKRIKVKGPGGQTGTVPDGTTLPDGWATQ